MDESGFTLVKSNKRKKNSLSFNDGRNFDCRPNDVNNFVEDDEISDDDEDDEIKEQKILECPLVWHQFALIGDVQDEIDKLLIKYQIYSYTGCEPLCELGKRIVDDKWQWNENENEDCESDLKKYAKQCERELKFISIIPNFTPRKYGSGKKQFFVHIRFDQYLLAEAASSDVQISSVPAYYGFLGEKPTHVPVSLPSADIEENRKNFMRVMKTVEDQMKHDEFQLVVEEELTENEQRNNAKKPYYNLFSKEDLTKHASAIYKCKLHLEDTYSGYGEILEQRKLGRKIYLHNRRNCYMAFNQDIVNIRVFQKETEKRKGKGNTKKGIQRDSIEIWSGSVIAVESSEVKPVNKIFLCKLSFGQANYMIPICKTIPNIEVDNIHAKNRVKDSCDNLIDGLHDVQGIENLMQHQVKCENSKKFADKCFVTLKSLHPDLRTTIDRLQYVDCYRCEFIFVVLYRHWKVDHCFPWGEVVGLYTPDASFAKAMPLIVVSCNLSVVGIEDRSDILTHQQQSKVDIKKNPHPSKSIGKLDRTRRIFNFRYPNQPFNEVAYSYESLANDRFRMGMHVVNVAKHVNLDDFVDANAKKKFFTYLLPTNQRTDVDVTPLYLFSEFMTTKQLSLSTTRAVDVFSFYFTVDRATSVVETDNNPVMELEQVVLTEEFDVNIVDQMSMEQQPQFTYVNDIFKACYKSRIERTKSHRIPPDWFYPDFSLKLSIPVLVISTEMDSLANDLVVKLLSSKNDISFPVMIDETVLHNDNFESWKKTVIDKFSVPCFPTLNKYFQFRATNSKRKPIRFSKQFLTKIESNYSNINLLKCDLLFPDVSFYYYKLDNIVDRNIITPRSDAGDSPFTVSITKPLKCFGDLLTQRLVTCCKIDSQSSYSSNDIFELCKMQNDRTVDYEKYSAICAAYDIKDKFLDVSFILDCVFEDVTEDSIIFHHPFLRHVYHQHSVFFESLGLSNVNFLSTDNGKNDVELEWITKIFVYGDTFRENTLELKYQLRDIYGYESVAWRVNLTVSDLTNEDVGKVRGMMSDDKYPKQLISETVRYMDPKITFTFKLERSQILRVQFNYDYTNGIMKICPELLVVNPHLRLCLCHSHDPFKYFIHPNQLCKINYRRFYTLDDYKEQFRILNRIEGIYQVITESPSYFIHNVKITWIAAKGGTPQDDVFGVVLMDHKWCTERFIKLGHRNMRIQDPVNTFKKAVKNCNMDFLACIQSFIEEKQVYWIGHAHVSDVAFVGDKDNIKVHLTLRIVHSNFPFKPTVKQLYSLEIMETPITARVLDRSLRKMERHTLAERIVMKTISNKENEDRVIIDYETEIKAFMKFPYILNEAQSMALRIAINREFSLIWGPPGTGKTMVGCIIAFSFTQINKRPPSSNEKLTVLYCGPSNQSVDVVAEKLMKTFGDNCPKLLRIFSSDVMNVDFPYPGAIVNGNKSPTPETLKSITLHHIVRQSGKPYAEKFKKYAEYFDANKVRDKVDRATYSKVVLKYQNKLKAAFNAEVKDGQYEIVLCTTVGACKKILDHCNISQVIMDESGMCTEPESIGPILKRRCLKNTVFIGDHKQLRPIITCKAAQGKQLNTSLFERVYEPGKAYCTMLNIQYRMHPSICEFPSSHFYNDDKCKLITALSENWSGIPKCVMIDNQPFNGLQYNVLKPHYEKSLTKNLVNIADDLWKGRRSCDFNCYPYFLDFKYPVLEKVLFYNVEGFEINQAVSGITGGANSKGNDIEVEAVKHLYRKLIRKISNNHPHESVLVITQYRLQENLLKDACSEVLKELKKRGDPRVSTVVRSQGSECDYVIFSTVRSLPHRKDIDANPSPGWISKYLGFITDKNQFNVAITRAKKGLFIIGNRQLLSVNENWRKMLTDLKSRGCLLDYPI